MGYRHKICREPMKFETSSNWYMGGKDEMNVSIMKKI